MEESEMTMRGSDKTSKSDSWEELKVTVQSKNGEEKPGHIITLLEIYRSIGRGWIFFWNSCRIRLTYFTLYDVYLLYKRSYGRKHDFSTIT